jgi:threonine/homoserine/homoserine lactone efflux protein
MEFFILASAHFLALLSPGVDFFLIVHTTLKRPIKDALKVCFGIASANALYILMAVLGLEIIRDLYFVLTLLRYLGSGYLIYIGVMLLKAKKIEIKSDKQSLHVKSYFLLGFLSAFLNPKNILFYFSLFSVIVSVQTSLHVRVLYGLWMSFAVLAWDVFVVYLLGNKRVKNRLSFYIYHIEKVAGIVLISFGVSLML